MLDAYEPLYLSEPPDRATYAARLAELPQRFPDDTEFLLMGAHQSNAALEQRIEWAARSVVLDELYSDGYQVHAQLLSEAGRREDAHAVLERCRAVVRLSADCVLEEMRLLREEGRCEAALELTGALRTRAPANDVGLRLQINLEAAVGRAEEDVRGTMTEVGSDLDAEERTREQTSLGARYAAFLGNLDETLGYRARIDAAEGAWGPAPLWLAADGGSALRELGRRDEAIAIATTTLRRRRAELGQIRVDPHTLYHEVMLIQAVEAGVDDASFANARDALERAYETGIFVDPTNRWAAFTAARADDPDSARGALEALGAEPPSYGEPATLAYAGRALLLAGRPAEAIPRLERVARGCERFDYPFLTIRALLWLSDAYEEAGDPDAACAAAREIMTRWGDTAPAAQTVLEARVRLSVCPEQAAADD